MTFAPSTADAKTDHKEAEILAFPLGIIKVWKGDIVVLKVGDGYAYPLYATGATGDMFAGVAMETLDNTGGSAGDKYVRVYRKGAFPFAIAATATQANVGDPIHGDVTAAGNPRTVIASTGHAPYIGDIVELISATEVRVDIKPGVTAAA